MLDLLFELATWHGLAKLRLHTTRTLNDLEGSTIRLGAALRKFQSVTCENYITTDLPSEVASRGRRKAAEATKKGTKETSKRKAQGKRKGKEKEGATAAKPRKFNLSTYKTHALGDYVDYIRRFGTTDNFSTSVVRSFHFYEEKPQMLMYCTRGNLSTDVVSGTGPV